MANIANLAINLTARTSAFEKRMRKSQSTIKRFGAGVLQIGRNLARFGTVAVGIASAALTVMTKRSMANIDVIAKLSDRIGVSTEFLSAFGHAASIAGTSQEEFSKSMEMFVRRLGEAKQGTGEAKNALKTLGFSIDEIISINPEQAFLRMAEGIRGLSTQAEKAAVAYQLFGRSGSKMLNLLESDTSNVVDEAKRLGITFNRLDAAKVEEANDAITNLKAAFTGLGNTIAIAVSPFIQEAADRLADFVASGDKVAAVNDSFMEIAKAGGVIIDVFNGIRSVVNFIVAGAQGLISIFLTGFAKIASAAEIFGDTLGIGGLAESARGAKEFLSSLADDFEKARNENLNQSADQFLSIGESGAKIDKFFKAVQERASNVKITPKMTPSALEGFIEPIKEAVESFSPGTSKVLRTSLVSVSGLAVDPTLQKTTELVSIQKESLEELKRIGSVTWV